MALLRRKKQDTETPAASAATPTTPKRRAAKPTHTVAASYASVVRPHVTEKSILLSERGTYAFDVFPYANKKQIAEFVRSYYGVTPVAVRIARKAGQKKFIRGRLGTKAGLKKAYVTLKAGDKIEFA